MWRPSSASAVAASSAPMRAMKRRDAAVGVDSALEPSRRRSVAVSKAAAKLSVRDKFHAGAQGVHTLSASKGVSSIGTLKSGRKLKLMAMSSHKKQLA